MRSPAWRLIGAPGSSTARRSRRPCGSGCLGALARRSSRNWLGSWCETPLAVSHSGRAGFARAPVCNDRSTGSKPGGPAVTGRLTAFLFLATLFCVSFEKIQWELAGTIGLSGILAALFVLSFGADRLSATARGFPRTVAIVLLFGLMFLLVYLAGFFNIETEQAADQFAKGLARFAITFAFAAAGIAYLARRPMRFYWFALGVLCAGIAFNGVYGIAHLAFAESGRDLDQTVLGPLLGDARPINFYGAVEGADVYRPNALTNDPNHLGIVLLLPLLILTPLYLRLERGHRLKVPLAVL